MRASQKTKLNFVVDASAFVAFVLLLSTGAIMAFKLRPGSGGLEIWGLGRHDWGDIHFWIAVVFLASLAVHVFLHWNWIVCVIKGRKTDRSGFRLGAGIVSLIILLMLALSPVLGPIEENPNAGKYEEHIDNEHNELAMEHTEPMIKVPNYDDGLDIRGSMSLAEISLQTKVPVAYILKKLGLPANTSKEEHLGRLSRDYGFTMSHAREIIAAYKGE